MRKFSFAAARVAAGILGAQSAGAATLAVECRSCTTGAQEEALALSTPGTGIRFVYNFRNHSIRKFKVYIDRDLPGSFITDAVPVEPQPTVGSREQTPSGTGTRTLYEMVVDRDVVALFQEMDAFNSDYANAWSKQFRVNIGNLGQTNGDIGVVNFDPQRIGWDYPGGEGRRFMQRINERLSDPTSATVVDGRLARYIHRVVVSANSAYVEGNGDGGTVGLQFAFGSVGSEFTVDFCSSDGSCVTVRLTITPNGLRSEYLGAFDKYDVPFPAMNESLPLRREWGRAGLENARSMARFIANRTNGQWTVEGGMNCNRVTLACVETGTHYVCTVHCP